MTQLLADISHWMGGDLSASPVGDVATVTGTTRGQQRVLRRLCTNPGSYMQRPTYGAGLGTYIGTLATAQEIESVIRAQMALESVVAKSPAPIISVTQTASALSIAIQYTDVSTNQIVPLSFTLDPTQT